MWMDCRSCPRFERDTPLLSDDFRQVLRSSDDPQNVLLRYFAKAPAHDPVSELLYVDTKTYMAPTFSPRWTG